MTEAVNCETILPEVKQILADAKAKYAKERNFEGDAFVVITRISVDLDGIPHTRKASTTILDRKTNQKDPKEPDDDLDQNLQLDPNDFLIGKIIGKGGFGEVKEAYWISKNNKKVAVKISNNVVHQKELKREIANMR